MKSRKTELRGEMEIKERLDKVKARIRAMSEDDGFINIESGDKDRDLILQGLLTTMFELAWVLGHDPIIFPEDLVNDDGTIVGVKVIGEEGI
jgi:hypothetical protein